MSTKQKPKFIVLCGGEGSGKSTVNEELKKRYSKWIFTREPGGTEYAEEIRKLILHHRMAKTAPAEALFSLFWAARAEHVGRLIAPSLQSGLTVVSDRFDCCTYAYQIFAQKLNRLKDLFWFTRQELIGSYLPDMYIFLDVDPKIGLERTRRRKGNNHFDERDIEFHKMIHEGYLDFFSHSIGIPHVTVDANHSKEEVLASVLEVIRGN